MLCMDSYYEEVQFSGLNEVGYLTLPREYISILGIVGNLAPVPVYPQFHQYSLLAFGYQIPTQMTMAGVLDQGDGFPSQFSIESVGLPGVLRIEITDPADAGKVIRIYGLDGDGKPIYNTSVAGAQGVGIATVYPTVDTSISVSVLQSLMTDNIFQSRWKLHVVNAGIPVQIGEYEPGDKRPRFRRYTCGPVNAQTTIRAACRRRFVPVMFDTDWVIPSHIGALKLGFAALNMEEGQRFDLAKPNWDNGYALLQNHMKSFRGSQLVRFPSLFNINFNLCQQTH